jgi:hypothetical protein
MQRTQQSGKAQHQPVEVEEALLGSFLIKRTKGIQQKGDGSVVRMMVACRVRLIVMVGMARTVVVAVPVDFFSFKGVRKPVYQGSGACAKDIDAKHDEQ